VLSKTFWIGKSDANAGLRGAGPDGKSKGKESHMMDFRVIKENDYFLLTDVRGDIPAENPEGLGFYTRDTRFLSRFELLVNGQKPVVLH